MKFPQKNIDWDKIKEDYIKNYPDISFEELEKCYGAPADQISCKALIENWFWSTSIAIKQTINDISVQEFSDFKLLSKIIDNKLTNLEYETQVGQSGIAESYPVFNPNFDLTTKEILDLVQARCLLQDFIHKTYKGEHEIQT